MKTKPIENVLKEHSDKMYLWEDHETIDIVVDDEEKKFIEEAFSFRCPICDNSIVDGNEKLFNNINDSVNGIQVKCIYCEQKMFIHKPVGI